MLEKETNEVSYFSSLAHQLSIYWKEYVLLILCL